MTKFLFWSEIFHHIFWKCNLLILGYLPDIEQFRISYFQSLNTLRLLKLLGPSYWTARGGSHHQVPYGAPWTPVTLGTPVTFLLSKISFPKFCKTLSFQNFIKCSSIRYEKYWGPIGSAVKRINSRESDVLFLFLLSPWFFIIYLEVCW